MAPHIFAISLPIHGHVNPMLHLLQRLASLGCKITFVTTTSTRKRAESVLEVSGKDDDNTFNLVSMDDGEGELYTLLKAISFMSSNLHQIQHLIQRAGPVTLFIVDFLLLDALKPLLQFDNLATYFVSAAAMLHICGNIHRLFEAGYLPKPEDPSKCNSKEVDAATIPGIPFKLDLYRGDVPVDPVDPITYKSMLGLRPLMQQAKCIFINTYDALEHITLRALEDDGFNVVAVGPLVDDNIGGRGIRDGEMANWLASQLPGSVVYVSFGSMYRPSKEQLEEIGEALVAMDRPFLWSFDWRRWVATEFVEKLRAKIPPGMGLVVDWCPQQQVLAHPNVGGFFSHCGWNSILEAASMGVPVVGFPLRGADHPVCCKFMVELWGFGTRVLHNDENGKVRFVTREEIISAIEVIMTDVDIRAKAKALAVDPDMDLLRKKVEKYVFNP